MSRRTDQPGLKRGPAAPPLLVLALLAIGFAPAVRAEAQTAPPEAAAPEAGEATGAAIGFEAGEVQAPATTAADLIQRGVALHDQGRYEEALAAYREALAKEPSNGEALYEMAFTLSSAGKLDECIATAEKGLAVPSRYRPLFVTVKANCLDMAGEGKKAVKVYEKGLREFPDNPLIAYNYAVAEVGRNHPEDARRLAKTAIAADPGYASAHRLLGAVYADSGYRVPAVLATLRFLSLEPTTPRAKESAQLVVALLHAGVERKSDSKINIMLGPDRPTDEGDFSATELLMAIGSTIRFTEENAGKSDIENLVQEVDTLISFFDEAPADERKSAFVWTTYVPFFVALHRAQLVEPFAYLAFSSLELSGGQAWLDAHADRVDELRRWVAGWSR